MKDTTFKRSKLGFTLAELLLVIAILVILVGLGVTGFLALRKNIVIAKYDDLAREIYVAAQNQLTRLDANGMEQTAVDALNGGVPLTAKPADYTADDWDSAAYRYADKSNHAMTVLLPLGAVADDVRSNGFYVIEYNAQTHMVYSVFYAESGFDYAAVSGITDFRASREVRKGPMVGYYGGSAVARDPLTHCETPQLEIINNNELRLNIRNVPGDVTVSVKISDGIKTVDVPANYIAYLEANGRTVLLDSLNPGKHFYQLFPELTPGKDLTLTVTYEKPGAIPASASIQANSLFATREGENGEVVTLAWARHLQNLETTVSNLNDSAIEIARQTEHIQWENEFGKFVSIRNDGANENLKRFEGKSLEIRDLRGTNGLYAQTKEEMELSGIRLVNPVITADDTDPVGALVGTAAAKTSIHMCGVFSRKLTQEQTVDYAAYSDCYVDGKDAVTGGLVGQATETTVTDSFAALPILKGQTGASLIGDAVGCTISNSYANSDELEPGFYAFISGENNIINHCYAVGNVADKNACAFAGGNDAVTDCYYAVSHLRFAENWNDNVTLAVTQFYYVGEDGTWVKRKQEQLQKDAEPGGLAEGKGWVYLIAPLSHPYREHLDGRAFPYPAIAELDHYGSWPDSDGKVDLKITMALLNSPDNAYAIFAGRVVVTDAEGKELFDSEKHKNADGTFDGKDTIQVPIDSKVRLEITPAEGYEYLNTTIETTRYTAKTLEYTVSKDTEAIVTFQQMAFQLKGLPAQDTNGSTITKGAYDIDLTSPLKTLNITNVAQEESVETGSTVTVRPKIPAGYSASVVWYTPKDDNSEEKRTYLTQGVDGNYTFAMPAQDTDVHVMYTDKEAFFEIEYYLMDTLGNYPDAPTQTADYKCGLGSQINQSMMNAMAESSGLPLNLEGEHVRYFAEAVVTSHKDSYQNAVFHSRQDENGRVTEVVGPHLTAEDESTQEQPYHVKIYIERKLYNVTLTADTHISGVRFGDTGTFQQTVTKQFRYGATVTAQADVAPGYRFTYWDPQDTRFMMSAETAYTFQVPHFDLNLKAIAATDRYLVTINLLEDDESWLYSSDSRQKDPITLTLVNSKDPTKTYPMQVLTEESISYAMQAVVPAVSDYGAGYYVQVRYASGLKTWIYTSGDQNGTDEQNEKLLLYVRDQAVEQTAKFYSVTYHANKKFFGGTVPKGGTYPMYYHLTVEGNSGLLSNLTDEDKIFAGWHDYYADGTGTDTVYTGGEILMVTKRTDMFAQWKSHLVVEYHAGEADGGTLPVDINQYAQNENVTIQWGSLTRNGYRFLGWSRQENAEVPEFTQAGQTHKLQTTDLHLYPVWQLEEYSLQFYDTTGTLLTGADYTITGKHYGDEILVPNLIVDGEQIIGWSTTRGGEIVCHPGEQFVITGNAVFYACTEPNTVQVTFRNTDGTILYQQVPFGVGLPGYLNYVPESGPVTAWSTQPNGKGSLFFCREDGRSETAVAFTEDTDLYAVTGKVYNYNQQVWFDTLYAAVRSNITQDGHTLIVYRNTEEQYNVWINKSLYVIASGKRTVKWKDGATTDDRWNPHRLNDKKQETGEFSGCMSVSNGSADVTVSFGKSDVPTLSTGASTLTFDANQQSRVIALGNSDGNGTIVFHMYDGITLTNGNRDRKGAYNENPVENSDSSRNNTNSARSFYGGGVYAGLNTVFYMHGGTISYCSAYKGGGVYLYANKDLSTPGNKMYMGDMVTPSAYSATAIYYTKGDDGFYINAPEKVTAENFKRYYVTSGSPQICYNTATSSLNSDFAYSDGGGGLLMLDLKDGDLVLYRGSIHNNEAYANGGGIVTDGGDTKGGVSGDYAKLRIYEVDISHNTAEGYGGGVYQWQGIVYIYNSTLRQNYAKRNGGGIYLHHFGTENSTVEFHYGDIADNKADINGGGIYVEDYQNMTITHGNLARNSAGEDGGGVYVHRNGGHIGKLFLQGGTVTDNVAKRNGGGIYATGDIDISGGTLSGNQAGNCGGGVYLTGTMDMRGGIVCDNNGRYLGGGVYMDGTFNFSGGSLYGNTDTDYETDHQADEDNVNPGPNDIYLTQNRVITIPRGGLTLSGEKRIAVDCENDESQRFTWRALPYRFAVYANAGDFKAADALLFTYYGTRSTQYSMETLNKRDLTVASHEDLGNNNTGLYFVEKAGSGESSYVTFDLNYPGCPAPVSKPQKVGTVLNINDEVPNATRAGYYLAGWARSPYAVEEQYALFYDVEANVWRSGYTPEDGWTKEDTEPKYTVQDLFNQTLYAMWRPCVVVYDVGDEARANGITIPATSIGPRVTVLNPSPMEYTVGDKTYYFARWENEDSTDDQTYTPMQQLELTENLRLRAVWEERVAGSVIITFYFNDGTSDQTGELRREILVKKGESYTIDVEIHQANKILVGWNTSPDGTGTQYDPQGVIANLEGDMNLYAMWADAVTLTYDRNCGDGGSTVVSLEKGSSVQITEEVPTRDGYIFQGWAETPDAVEAKYQPGDTIERLDQNTTLYAVWVKAWTVSFDLDGGTGTGFDPVQVPNGEPFVLPTKVPKKEGYTFQCWTVGMADYWAGWTVPSVTSDICLKAVWGGTLFINPNGGNLDGSSAGWGLEMRSGAEYRLDSLRPTREGYVLKGWATKATAMEPEYRTDDVFIFDKTVTLYAVWEPVGKWWVVSFDLDGGTGTFDPMKVPDGGEYILPDTRPTRDGYTFQGWSVGTQTYGSGAHVTVNSNITFKAIWVGTLSFDPNGGSFGGGAVAPRPKQLKIGEEFPLSDAPKPTRIGYVLSGWSTDPNATVPTYTSTDTFVFRENTTLYAVWEEGWTISFDLNGGTGPITAFGTTTVRKGAQYTLPPVGPSRSGYRFIKWTVGTREYNPGDTVTVTSDMMFKAIWEGVPSFDTNGGIRNDSTSSGQTTQPSKAPVAPPPTEPATALVEGRRKEGSE